MKNKRKIGNIEASSMADIAFLLLTFFMMVTTINQDKGLLFKLPKYEKPDPSTFNKRNVMEILINDNGELLVNDKKMDLETMKEEVYLHITNNGKLNAYSLSSKKAIILVKNSRGTKYIDYILVQDELKQIYKKIRNETALYLSNSTCNYKTLTELSKTNSFYLMLKNQVQDSIPFLVQENLPFN